MKGSQHPKLKESNNKMYGHVSKGHITQAKGFISLLKFSILVLTLSIINYQLSILLHQRLGHACFSSLKILINVGT